MPGFLYYIPGASGTMNPEAARGLPCGYAFGDCKGISSRGVLANGPDGGSGLLIARSGSIDDAELGYFADKQTWLKMNGQDVWIGWTGKESPPQIGPDDLARDEQLNGHMLKLGDDREWLIPAARRWVKSGEDPEQYCVLPRVYKLQDDGTWGPTDIRAKFQKLWKIACEFLMAVACGRAHGDGWVYDFETTKALDFAATALQMNYRIGRDEIAILELLDDRNALHVLDALNDMQTYYELGKSKKD